MFRLLPMDRNLAARCPLARAAAWSGAVVNGEGDRRLWADIGATLAALEGRDPEAVKANPVNAATRAAYKACGKDPSRYRPAAEQLWRRAARGLGLYRVNAAVDLANMVSLRTGFSLGVFDAGRVEGPVTLGLGRAGELYEAIGRGPFNIEGLPVLRDARGAFGSPSSDAERTKVSADTAHILLVVYDFGRSPSLDAALELAAGLLRQYVGAALRPGAVDLAPAAPADRPLNTVSAYPSINQEQP